jgi:hypothetical protein
MRYKLEGSDYGLIAAAVFFGFVALGGLNIALWQHNPTNEWEAVCWFNGLITSWALPALIAGTYCAIQESHDVLARREREIASDQLQNERQAAEFARKQAHWDSMSHEERNSVLLRKKRDY